MAKTFMIDRAMQRLVLSVLGIKQGTPKMSGKILPDRLRVLKTLVRIRAVWDFFCSRIM